MKINIKLKFSKIFKNFKKMKITKHFQLTFLTIMVILIYRDGIYAFD